ncbi:unnamed protein product [Hermetia illucens]|uniref:Peptidase M12A domain-containing protein n=1 Tax=Hermetia illucens TaxID=343691 RepID=A0A7R8UZ46_HERIL|nr:unnamed protein product [Hermetia illucens]
MLLAAVVTSSPSNRMSDREARATQKLYEKGNYFEGDMLFPDGFNMRNGITYLPWRWTNNTVYYEISSEYTNAQKNIIIGGLNEIQGATCIRFVPRTDQPNYIHIKYEKPGCSAYVGMIGGGQRENIEEEYKFSYDKYDENQITDFGVQYDYESIMHYHDTAFSMNGEKTIITKDPAYQNVIGMGQHLSAGDIAKIKAMYKC